MTASPITAVGTDSVGEQLDRLPVGAVHRKVVVAVGLGLFFEMYEIFLSSTLSATLSHDFGIRGTAPLKLVLASSFIGMFFGAAFFGRLADRMGRRKAFLLGLSWFSAFSLAGAFAPSPALLVLARFLAGVGIGAVYPVADSYLADVLPKEHRGRLASYADTCSFLAVPFAAFLAWWLAQHSPLGIAGWRWLLALGAGGAVIVFILNRWLPESPRWLASAGRFEEAQRALNAFAAGSDVPAVQINAGPQIGRVGRPAQSALTQLRRAPYNRRVVMLTVFHLFQTYGYYGFGTLAALVLVSRGYDVTSSMLFSALSFLGYPIGSLMAIPLLARFERKFLLVGSIVAVAGFGLLFATQSSVALIVVFGFMTTATSNIFSNVYHVYQAEIFPTTVRATAVGWTYSLSRLSSGASPFVLIPILDRYGAGAMFTVVATALAVVIAAVLTLGPRTSRRSLEEINPV
ncbi:MFS transporter [Mycobacterium montefiorense]|uniref:MFS transporter n=1 Tax=Mycobacterium montefiorense TaxID=154654 RepID=A0ABQ0NUA3_9MYCO|nr:MFS transporter [Mycobacterium montefiorense]GBG40372.1 MFS transporter [Mycobacterium montefiorense]GKU46465.1 MFS transporter [Mycobacterium montefiorense]GKU53654.1 MFS transporter [Mycobacterium montefiorense]GKU58762.1 MFS transporter [Mycobacterium montefiorense]GKU69641.1 MFS transporter [Mycobacterium montefiorense]